MSDEEADPKYQLATQIAQRNRLQDAATEARFEIARWEQHAVDAETSDDRRLANEARKQAEMLTQILAPYEVELQRQIDAIEQAKLDLRRRYQLHRCSSAHFVAMTIRSELHAVLAPAREAAHYSSLNGGSCVKIFR